MLVVLEVEFDLCAVYSSGLIDFLYCQLCAVLYSHCLLYTSRADDMLAFFNLLIRHIINHIVYRQI